MLGNGLLGEDRSDQGAVAGVVGLGGQQDEQAGGRAHEDRVDEDAEGLDEALAHGVGDGRGASGIGDGSEPGLVGEQPATHAVEQCREDSSGGAEQGLVEAEGPFKDAPQDLGEPTDVENDDHHGHEHVGQRHKGGQPLRDTGHEPDPAQDHGSGEQNEEDPDHPARDAGDGGGDDLGQRVRLHHDHCHADRDDAHGGEDFAPQGRSQTVLDVVGRAPAEGEVPAALLEDLGERGLHEAGGHADEGDDPHPEQGSGTAGHNGQGDSGDVPDADSRGQSHGEGLEGGDTALRTGARPGQRVDHGAEVAQLNQVGAGGQVDADQDEQGGKKVGVEEVVDGVEQVLDAGEVHASAPVEAAGWLLAGVAAGTSSAVLSASVRLARSPAQTSPGRSPGR